MFVRFALVIVFISACLFIAAGTWRWPEGWVLVALYAVLSVGSRYLVLRRHPDLIEERAQAFGAQGAKRWDKVLAPVVSLAGSVALLVVAGLDFRFGWSPAVPVWAEVVAFVALVLAYLFSIQAMLENRFFSAVVRIQTERGHEVVSAGPYRYVRHPGYLGAIVTYLAIPVALGTLWALAPGVITCALTVVRTALEDKTLRSELPGYADYAARVRWRLLPGVW
jgi:protein-S-isoprenylcysteine O-methyltransferase Ste14